MEKQMKKKNKNDTVNVTKIYETIKDKGFIQALWLDVMSDMKEKPSYKRLKGMVEKVIESSVENYATKPKDQEERLKTRTIFTDLSIMTYTIDTLISELLYKKLKDEFKSIISNIVEEVKSKPNSLDSENQQSKSSSILDDIEIVCNGGEEHDKNEGAIRKRKQYSKTAEEDKDLSLATSLKENTSSSKSNKNLSCNSLNSKSIKLSNKKSETQTLGKMDKNENHPNKSSGSLAIEENSDVDIINISDSDDDDDGNRSLRSVSSVHTSELSSFEDDISISSEDEDGMKTKKHVPLKLASSLYQKGKLSDLHKVSGTSSNKTMSPKMSTPIKSSDESPNQRLSSRMRKPNFKYASDDVLCPIKQIFSPTDSCSSDKESQETIKSSEKEISSGNKVKRGRPRKVTNESSVTHKLVNQEGKQERRGRPSKNKNIQIEDDSETEVKKKRGRPLKIVSVTSLSGQAHLSFDPDGRSHLSNPEGQDDFLGAQTKNYATYSDSKLKRKRGRPTNENSVKKIREEPMEHSVESFSLFEESLLKDKRISSPKNSSKSYSTSDLYKPRSDFRVSFNGSRGSKALTLFSN